MLTMMEITIYLLLELQVQLVINIMIDSESIIHIIGDRNNLMLIQVLPMEILNI